MRGCTLNKKKDCEAAGFSDYKLSDKRELSADAKIIIALSNEQPLKREPLCKKAGVDESTFSRIRRVLLNNKVIKKTDSGYCLYNFIERPTLWDKIKQKCLDAGGSLTDLTVNKLVLGEQDPITGWFKKNYEIVSIKGIIIHRGAIELKAAASVIIPDDYSMFLLTKAYFQEGDRLSWKHREYKIKTFEEIYDGNNFSYRIFKLV